MGENRNGQDENRGILFSTSMTVKYSRSVRAVLPVVPNIWLEQAATETDAGARPSFEKSRKKSDPL
jgi:hypothetical protein